MPALLSFQNKPLHLLHVFRQIEQVNRAGKSSRPNRAGESSEREGGGYGPYTYGCGAWGVRGGGGVCKEDEACTEESNETRKSVMETHGVETHTGQYGCTHGVEWDPPHTGTGGALGGTHANRRMRGTTQANADKRGSALWESGGRSSNHNTQFGSHRHSKGGTGEWGTGRFAIGGRDR